MLAADAAEVEAAHELTDPRYRLPEVSRTYVFTKLNIV